MVAPPSINETKNTPQLLYVIVLNWNGKQDVLECLASLKKQTYPNLHILLVDNHSNDGSPVAVQESFPDVEIIINPDNLGFGPGLNVGIRHALSRGSDFVFTVGNDTTLDPHCIEMLVEHATSEIGLLSPMIYFAQQPNVIWAIGGKTNRWTLEKESKWDGHPDRGDWPELLEMDFVTGCALLFPRSTIERIGMFDESFFPIYYEDSDLCLRIRQAGLSIVVVPRAKMWHKVASSSGGLETPRERYLMARSSVHFFAKHARGLQIPAVIIWRTGSAIRTTLRLVSRGKWDAMFAYWRGLFDGLSRLSKKAI